MRRRLAGLAILAATAIAMCRGGTPAPPLRFATFNIEEFPQGERQIEGAFAEIARLDVGFVAVQEIHDGSVFAAEAHRRLGADWAFVQAEPGARFDLGVLYDERRYALVSQITHDETRLGGMNKPVFEVRLRARRGGDVLRVLVVHLRCCTEGRDTRARQHAALAGIVREARGSGERLVVLGDFNATDDADRGDLAALAAQAALTWASEPLACSAFWARDDGCPRSRLDHVLTWAPPIRVEAAGACATDGCAWQDRCPLYNDEISDHCPIVVTIAP